jgi:hypothetical protein
MQIIKPINFKYPKMMKRLLLLIHFICLSNYSIGQLNLEDIFPIKLGCSKFEALEAMGKLKNIVQEFPFKDMPSIKENEWVKFDYLKGDSVYISVLHFEDKRGIWGRQGKLSPSWILSFVDDRLYKFRYSLYYGGDNDKWESDFILLKAILDKSFILSTNTVIKRQDTMEQMGKGIKYFDKLENQRNPNKPNYYEIEKTLNIISIESSGLHYIDVIHVNCEGTKLMKNSY